MVTTIKKNKERKQWRQYLGLEVELTFAGEEMRKTS